MSKNDTFWLGFLVGSLISCTFLGWSSSNSIQYTTYKINKEKLETCEKELPRHQNCELYAKPKGDN